MHKTYFQSDRTDNRNAMSCTTLMSAHKNRTDRHTKHSTVTKLKYQELEDSETESWADQTELKSPTPPIYGTADNSPAICHARTLMQH